MITEQIERGTLLLLDLIKFEDASDQLKNGINNMGITIYSSETEMA